MSSNRSSQPLTQLEFSPEDFEIAGEIATRLGYTQTPYTSTSALWGLFCLPENPACAKPGQATTGAVIIKTKELGLLVVQDLEDLHFQDLFERQLEQWRKGTPTPGPLEAKG